MADKSLYIGLMSGTSLDGVDGVLTGLPGATQAVYVPFPDDLKREMMVLQSSSPNEIHREALAANRLAAIYAECVKGLIVKAGVSASRVNAIGAHGQTIRHLPAAGYTRQINNPALLAELTGIDVIADFRSRDVAAGGQGAPLVPAFHQAVFGSQTQTRVVANIGGISNISILTASGDVTGFDTGPGNLLMDGWISRHQDANYDAEGAWAAGGRIEPALLAVLMAEPFLALPPPKSTGRDLFHMQWLNAKLAPFATLSPQNVQATLAAFSSASLAGAIRHYAPDAAALYVCGGGAQNTHLMNLLQQALPMPVTTTDVLGVPAGQVEARAFAWLAERFCERQPGNLPAVTGARGKRILGALYPG